MSARAVPINPKLPKKFHGTPNEARPPSHMRWWGVPYIETFSWKQNRTPNDSAQDREKWYEAWPSGTRFDVRCLDGGAWDRPTWWGSFATLSEAIRCASTCPVYAGHSK